jgi:hypothetical protein
MTNEQRTAPTSRAGRWQQRLILLAVLGMASWFFGNLYEAVVLSPNWIRDSPAQFARLDAFFAVTGPTLYFVPVTPLALLLTWLLWWRSRDPGGDPALRAHLRRAAATSLALAVLTAGIVVLVIPRMFGPDALADPAGLRPAALWWNALNVGRMILTAATGWHLFRAFRHLDRQPA